MQIHEKLIKPVIETKYLTVENADRYRSIIRLFYRYGSQLKFWQYDIAYYITYLSSVILSDTRLKKLSKVTDPQLLEIKMALEKEKRATYQEAMLDVYERYLKSFM